MILSKNIIINDIEIDVEKLLSIIKHNNEDMVIIDIRSEYEYAHGRLPKSIHIDYNDIKSGLIIDENKNYVVYCARGKVSEKLAKEFRDKGNTNFYSLKGGFNAYLLYMLRNDNKSNDEPNRTKEIEKSIQKIFYSRFVSKFLKAIKEYDLIHENDSIAVCISGGKDSFLMAMLFKELKKWLKIKFDVQFICMDPGYSKFNRTSIEENAKLLGLTIRFFETNIFDSVLNVEKSPCYLCARMRRGYLYSFAKQLSCNKIALAHHFDDVIETVLMGMLYGGQIQSMQPKLKSKNFDNMELIRPMYLIREEDIIKWKEYNRLNFIQCACKLTDTCSTIINNEAKSKRLEIKNLIRDLKVKNGNVEKNIFKSIQNVQLDTLLSYKSKGVEHSYIKEYDL